MAEGGIDKGNVRFRIDVEGTFAERLKLLRTGILQARNDFRGLRDDVRQLGPDARRSATDLAALVASSRRLRTETAAVAKQQAAANASASAGASASNSRTTAVRAQEQAERRLSLVQRQALALERQLRQTQKIGNDPQVQQLRTRLTVTQQLLRAQQRLRVEQSLADRGRDTKTGENDAERQRRTIIEAQSKAKQAQVDLDNKALLRAQAKLATEQKILKAQQQQGASASLRSQGLSPQGTSTDQQAFENLNRSLDSLQLEETRQRLRATDPEFQKLEQRAQALSQKVTEGGKNFDEFGRKIDKTNATANRISFTFRRLFGILAAFAAARLVFGFFADLVKDGVKFNAMIEQATLGLGSLFTAVGDVRDATGAAVDKASQLPLAMEEARRQVALLRSESLKAPGTFTDLLEAFQVAVAPGRQAGLIVDQIRKFTVQISQAAAALGVPQNQLSEEIRSILSGTIQARTTRIATALGITNEDVRRAKELGKLSEFLETRFKAFSVAGQQALGTFDVIISNLQDALEQLFGGGAKGLFDQLKGLLSELQAGAQSEGPGGILKPNPEAVAVVRALLDGLAAAVAEARRLRTELSLSELEPVARAIGHAFELVATFLGRSLEIVLHIVSVAAVVINAAFTLVEGLLTALGRLVDALGLDKLLRVAETVVGIGLGLKVLVLIFLGLKASVVFLVGVTKLWQIAMLGVKAVTLAVQGIFIACRAVILSLLSPVGAVVLGVIALAVLTKAWVDDLIDADSTLRSIGEVLKEVAADFASRIALSVGAGLDRVLIRAKAQIRRLNPFDQSDTEINKQESQQLSASTQAEELITLAMRARHLERLRQIKEENRLQIESGDTITAKLKGALDQAKGALGGLAQDLGLSNLFGLNSDEDVVAQVKDLASAIDALPPVLGRGERDVDGLTESLKQLEEELRRVRGEAKIAASTAGLEGFTSSVREEVLGGQVKLQEEALKLDRESDQLRATQIGRQVEINRLLATANELQVGAQVAEGQKLAKERLDLRRKVLETETQIALTDQEAQVAQRDGDDKALAAADARKASLLDTLGTLKQFLAGNDKAISGLGAGSPEQAQAVVDIVTRLVELRGQEVGTDADLADLAEQRGRLENQITAIVGARVATIGRQESAAAQQRLGIARAELQAEQLRAQAANIFGIDTLEQRRAVASGELIVEQAKLKVLQDQAALQKRMNDVNLHSLEQALVQQKAALQVAKDAEGAVGADGEPSRAVLDAELAVSDVEEGILELRRASSISIDEQNIALDQQKIKVNDVALEAERLRKQQEEGFSFGIQTAFAEFSESALNTFEQWQALATQAFTGLAEALGAAAADAIDPNTNADLRTKLGNLFKAIGQQLFTNIFSQLIANIGGGALSGVTSATALTAAATTLTTAGTSLTTAALSQRFAATSLKLAAAALQAAATGSATNDVVGAVAVAVHSGGDIPKLGKASLAHYLRPQGLRVGGRPKGIHPADTVPIWAEPGEHMIRKSSVQMYWPQTMDAINRGLVDPVGLRELAGVGSAVGAVTTPSAPSFAGGGRVTEDVGRTDRGSRGDLQRTALVADEATMEQLLRGGRESMLAFFNERNQSIGVAAARR